MKVLIAVDFSQVTDTILTRTHELVRAPADAELHFYLMHVAEPDPDFVGWEAGPDVVRDQIAAEFHREHRQLEDLARELRAASGAAVTPLLVQGPIVETVCEKAVALDATLVVVGSHGHGATYDLLVGSISNGIIKRSPIPILVIPDPGRSHPPT